MVKLTGPLHSLSARGTIANALTYRRHATGTIATRTPRHPQALPDALRSNTIVLKFVAWTAKNWGIIESPGWLTLANTWHVPRYTAYVRYQIRRINANKALNNDPDYDYENPSPPKPEIVAYLIEGSTTPLIRAAGVQDFEYMCLYRSTDPYFEPSPATLIAIFPPYNGVPPFEDRYDLHGSVYYRAVTWYIISTPSETSDPVQLDIP